MKQREGHVGSCGLRVQVRKAAVGLGEGSSHGKCRARTGFWPDPSAPEEVGVLFGWLMRLAQRILSLVSPLFQLPCFFFWGGGAGPQTS